jgi:hypothetical protein
MMKLITGMFKNGILVEPIERICGIVDGDGFFVVQVFNVNVSIDG